MNLSFEFVYTFFFSRKKRAREKGVRLIEWLALWSQQLCVGEKKKAASVCCQQKMLVKKVFGLLLLLSLLIVLRFNKLTQFNCLWCDYSK